LNICLQVNTDNEPSKAGVGYEALDELADAAAQMPGLVLRGLMAIPAPRESFEAQRAAFAKLKQSFDRLGRVKLPAKQISTAPNLTGHT